MPNYDYMCPKCGYKKDFHHSMDEVSNPSEETVFLTSCPGNLDCEYYNPEGEQVRFQRVPQPIQLMGMSGGTSLMGPDKIKETQKERKLRSKNHFANEMLPSLPKVERLQIKRKWHKEGFKPKLNKND